MIWWFQRMTQQHFLNQSQNKLLHHIWKNREKHENKFTIMNEYYELDVVGNCFKQHKILDS